MRERPQSFMCDRISALVVVTTLLGLILRIWGANFGLPQTYHPDEALYIPDAVRFISTLDFKPFRWADQTLFKYLLALEYGVVYLPARGIGQIESLRAFEASYYNNPSIFYLLGRLSSGVLGAATIPVVYGLGGQAYGRKQGLVAAFLLALCFLHVRDSHYAVSDVPMTFFFSAAILCLMVCQRYRKSRYFYFAASLTGLAIATKFTASLLVVVLIATWALVNYSGDWRDLMKALRSRELFIAFAIMGLSFLVVSPYALLDYHSFLGTLRTHYGMGKTGSTGYQIDPAGGWLFYLKTLFWGMGPTLAIVAILSVGYALYRHRRVDLFILLPALLLYIYMGRQQTYFARFIIPVLPLLTVLTASFVWDLSAKFFRASHKSAEITAIMLAILSITPSTIAIIRHNILLTRADTRTLAKQWIESHIPAGATFFVEWHTPPLATEFQPNLDASQTYEVNSQNTGWVNGEMLPVPDSTRTYKVQSSYLIGLAEHPLSYYRGQGYQYLIASSFIYNIPRANPEEDRARRAFYEQLGVEAELAQVFKPYAGENEPPFIFDQLYGPATSLFRFERPGPTIKVYRLQQN